MLTELVAVDGVLTLEQRHVTFDVNERRIEWLSIVSPLESEALEYDRIERDLDAAFLFGSVFNTSRRLVKTYEPDDTSVNCFSSFQLLRDRFATSLAVVMRSCNSNRASSDMGFVSRLARRYGATWVHVTVGSFHTELVWPVESIDVGH